MVEISEILVLWLFNSSERNEKLLKRKSKCHLKNLYPQNTTSADLRIQAWGFNAANAS